MRALFVLIAALGLSLPGCAADDASVLTSRLQECGLVSPGEVGPQVTRSFYAPDACYRDCLAGATCDELSNALCGTSITLERACDERCAFRCPDDSLIALERVCDGIDQCEGGADEEDCGAAPEAFSCRRSDGFEMQGDWFRCDRRTDCADGSDERGCAVHVCANGEERVHLPSRDLRCDGGWSCGDGSDELDCAQLLTAMCVGR